MKLAWKNIKGRPGRSFILILLSALISFVLFSGTFVTRSMQTGTESLRARLGADLIVVSEDADPNVESLLIKGNPGYFYMDQKNLDIARSIPNVKTASPQLFLTTANTGCCAMPVQLIGFDPDTDFTVQPWIDASYGKELGDGDILIGHNLTPEDDMTIIFYDRECHVAGRLASTGTDFDNAVYTNMETIRSLMSASKEKGFNYLINEDAPETLVSSIFIRVDSPENITEVKKELNVRLEGVKVIQTSGMLTASMENLTRMSGMFRLFTGAIWILTSVILVISYISIINERKKEFAIFRIIGASNAGVMKLVLSESVIYGISGGIIGIIAGLLLMLPFSNAIEKALGMPYLAPSVPEFIKISAIGISGTFLSCIIAALLILPRILIKDSGILVRAGE